MWRDQYTGLECIAKFFVEVKTWKPSLYQPEKKLIKYTEIRPYFWTH